MGGQPEMGDQPEMMLGDPNEYYGVQYFDDPNVSQIKQSIKRN